MLKYNLKWPSPVWHPFCPVQFLHHPHTSPSIRRYRGSQCSNTSSFASNRHDSERIRGLYCIDVNTCPAKITVCRSLDWDGTHRPPAEGFTEVAVYKASMLDSCWDSDPQGCSMNRSHSWCICPQRLCLEFKNSFPDRSFSLCFFFLLLVHSGLKLALRNTRQDGAIILTSVCVCACVHSSIMQASGQNKDCD